MLEKSAKISPNACAVVSLPDEHGHAENSYIFVNDADFRRLGEQIDCFENTV